MEEQGGGETPGPAMVGGHAYVRNLAAAEAAVMRGQFNLAKVLRALAHTQRVQAMHAARRLAAGSDPASLLDTILGELEERRSPATTTDVSPAEGLSGRAAAVRERARSIARQSLASLGGHSDVPEGDVPHIWGCYACGNLIEDRANLLAEGGPAACDLCGALNPEFAWYGPFYSSTPEHLGQREPAEIIAILAAVPGAAAEVVAGIDDGTLTRRPAADEWCAKEILGHMLETDRSLAWRARIVLGHDGPGLPLIDAALPPWRLHEGKAYDALPIDAILERLGQVRAATLAQVSGLSPQQWGLRGIIDGRAVTLLDLGTWVANHDLGHLAQVRRLCG